MSSSTISSPNFTGGKKLLSSHDHLNQTCSTADMSPDSSWQSSSSVTNYHYNSTDVNNESCSNNKSDANGNATLETSPQSDSSTTNWDGYVNRSPGGLGSGGSFGRDSSSREGNTHVGDDSYDEGLKLEFGVETDGVEGTMFRRRIAAAHSENNTALCMGLSAAEQRANDLIVNFPRPKKTPEFDEKERLGSVKVRKIKLKSQAQDSTDGDNDEFELIPTHNSTASGNKCGENEMDELFENNVSLEFAKNVMVDNLDWNNLTKVQFECLRNISDGKTDAMIEAPKATGKSALAAMLCIASVQRDLKQSNQKPVGHFDNRGTFLSESVMNIGSGSGNGLRSDFVSGICLPRALIIQPTRELVIQTTNWLKIFVDDLEYRITALYGGGGTTEVRGGGVKRKEQRVNELCKGCDILVATPGKLQGVVREGILDLFEVNCLVLEDADTLLRNTSKNQSGNLPNSDSKSFGKFCKDVVDYMRNHDKRDKINDLQVILTSQAYPLKIKEGVKELLRPGYLEIINKDCSLFADSVNFQFHCIEIPGRNTSISAPKSVPGTLREIDTSENVSKKRYSSLVYLEDIFPESETDIPKKVVIFLNTKHRANAVHKKLEKDIRIWYGDKIDVYCTHGDQSQGLREKVYQKFRDDGGYLVTSDLARVWDIKDINYVINLDCPNRLSDFKHRASLVGRVGNKGTVITFFAYAIGFNWKEIVGPSESALEFYKCDEEWKTRFDIVREMKEIGQDDKVDKDLLYRVTKHDNKTSESNNLITNKTTIDKSNNNFKPGPSNGGGGPDMDKEIGKCNTNANSASSSTSTNNTGVDKGSCEINISKNVTVTNTITSGEDQNQKKSEKSTNTPSSHSRAKSKADYYTKFGVNFPK